MEFEPKSEIGKSVLTVLDDWMKKSPDWALDKLKRIFITNSPQVANEDEFLAALYGQNILDETPPVLVRLQTLIYA